MRSKIRFIGYSCLAAIAIAGGVTTWLVSEGGVATPSQAASVNENHEDPAPQRLQLAPVPTTGGGSTLPGGASSLTETYKDWRVACVQQGTAKRCAMSQVQTQQNGQRVLAVELSPPSGNTISGTLVMPFGLALDSGVAFQIDDNPAMQPIRFRTCVPGGCLVNISFDAPTLVALRAGAALKVKATADGGASAPFSISLQGFGTALDRVAALAR
ncbi:invasion associated locus B family protein [Mesorhizobium sp. BAC0120]|uniref:invasion associated locus B family protein n=1 Tax=Mesorhizobium sp. BAC0120 TaxID=3090670 RepID=UPI00298CB5B0|nr:invasion associated locus B family protein [Mesorhizobium sp. BAC0120]MDW6023350.1 invasion associated locus B family protein [Mesorhizobium sp. BAC0120]